LDSKAVAKPKEVCMLRAIRSAKGGCLLLLGCLLGPITLIGQVVDEPINYAVDPGFEEGTAFTEVGVGAPGWNFWTTNDVFLDELQPHTGNFCGALGLTLSNPYQEVGYGQWVEGLTPDATYIMTAFGSIDYYEPTDPMQWGLYIGVQNFGGDKVQTTIYDLEYTPVILVFTMGSDVTGADIFAWRGPGGEARADDYGVWDYHNYLINPDFESNDLSSWDLWNYNTAIDTQNPHGDVCAAAILDGEGGFAQLIPNLIPGVTYGMKGFAKVTNEGDMVWWGVKNYGSDQVAAEVTQTAFTEGNIAFTMGAENTTAEVFFWKASGGPAYCDDLLVCKMIDAPGGTAVNRHIEHNVPDRPTLYQNYPNPFNSETTIDYDLSQGAAVKIELFDISGHYVRTLVNEWQSEGNHLVKWNGRDVNERPLSSGVYIVQLRVDTESGVMRESKKVTLLQ